MCVQMLPDSKLGINWTEVEMSPELKQTTEILFVCQAEGTAASLRTLTSLTQKSGYSLSFPNTWSQDLGKILSYSAS